MVESRQQTGKFLICCLPSTKFGGIIFSELPNVFCRDAQFGRLYGVNVFQARMIASN